MDFIREVLKGILVGIANITPGVSGGALAVSMGIYDKIIGAITHIVKDTRRSIIILLPYGIGAVTGVVLLSFAIEFLFMKYPFQTSLTFIGLIMGGVPALLGTLKGKRVGIPGYLTCGVLFAAIMVMTLWGGGIGKTADLSPTPIHIVKLFGIGMIGAATMIIPGVSGTMLLMMMGYYQPIISSINRFLVCFATGEWGDALVECSVLIPFGLGILIGMFLCAKLIEWLLEHHMVLTYCAILGLVFSSPVIILMGVPRTNLGLSGILMGMVCLILSCWGSSWLSKREE